MLEPEELLGKGNSTIDKVINSILFRASASVKLSKLSLVVMVVLVFFGGGASIGTIALDQFTKVREVEKQRMILLNIVQALRARSPEFPFPGTTDTTTSDILSRLSEQAYYRLDSAAVARIKEIVQSAYGLNDTSYEKLLDSLNRESTLSITQIVMRVTLAALTFFLVQVFFQIYRYNQQRSTHLFAKAEVFELYNDEEADKKYLRDTLTSKIEENPKFGKSPASPIEQIISIADKKV